VVVKTPVFSSRFKANASNIFLFEETQIYVLKSKCSKIILTVHVPLFNFIKIQLFVVNNSIYLLTKTESYIIEQVKKRRNEKGISQMELSQKLGLSSSFVSHVESSKRRAKYNVNHLNELARIFECSPKDFWPDKPI
jgi:DNA-binding Xre family transcriptional regulator